MKPGIGLLLGRESVSWGPRFDADRPPRVARRQRGWILGAHYGRGSAAGFVSRAGSLGRGYADGVGGARARCAGRRGSALRWRVGAGRARPAPTGPLTR